MSIFSRAIFSRVVAMQGDMWQVQNSDKWQSQKVTHGASFLRICGACISKSRCMHALMRWHIGIFGVLKSIKDSLLFLSTHVHSILTPTLHSSFTLMCTPFSPSPHVCMHLHCLCMRLPFPYFLASHTCSLLSPYFLSLPPYSLALVPNI
jgi:hypothetical protein